MSESQVKVKNDIRKELLEDFLDKEYAHGYIDDFLNTEIATQIRVLREEQGLTQDELAELTGMKQSRISVLEDVYYESWSIKTLKSLAYALDVSLKVSFETFTSRIGDVVNLSRESLERKPRELDLATYIDKSSFVFLHPGLFNDQEPLANSQETWKEIINKGTQSDTSFNYYIDTEHEKEHYVSMQVEESTADATIKDLAA